MSSGGSMTYVEAQCCGLVEPESPLLAGAVAVKKGAALARTCVERKETYKILNIMSNKFIFSLKWCTGTCTGAWKN